MSWGRWRWWNSAMRRAASARAPSWSAGHSRMARSTSEPVMARPWRSTGWRSKRWVQSLSASSPRRRTSAMMADTTSVTSCAVSRLSSSSRLKAASKWVSARFSLRAIGTLPETLDPAGQLFRPGLERRSVDDQPRGDIGDPLYFDKAIGLQRGPGGHQVHDQAAQAEAGRQLHCAVQLDAFRLHAALGEMLGGDGGVFGGDANMAPARRIVLAGQFDRFGHRQMAFADAEIERGIDLGIVELHQHVIAGDADLGGAERDEGGDVEGAHADDVDMRMVGGKAECAGFRIVEIRLGFDTGGPHQRHRLVQNPALGQGQHQFIRSVHRNLVHRVRSSRRWLYGARRGGERGYGAGRVCDWVLSRFRNPPHVFFLKASPAKGVELIGAVLPLTLREAAYSLRQVSSVSPDFLRALAFWTASWIILS